MKNFLHLEKIGKVTLILLILGIGCGLLITAQWKTKTLRVSNPIAPYANLAETRDSLTMEQTKLKEQISVLQDQIEEDQTKLKLQNQSKKKVEELEKLKEQVGLTEIKGKGLIITMNDAKIFPANIDSITHAADLRDLINFIWGAGASAISINGERIVYNTSIDCIVNTILINSTKTTVPFIISVVGDQDRMLDELNNENNLKDIHKRQKNEGLIFEISESRNITIPAYDGSFPIENAKIVK